MDKETLEILTKAIEPMRNNTLRNYIVPGLTSHLIGGPKAGLVRLFHSERETREFITPHSHRFDFTCLVLNGDVVNTLFRQGYSYDDAWCLSTINQVCGKDGLNEYQHLREDKPSNWRTEVKAYTTGDTYSMKHTEIHSIKFGKDTRVLFFESPQLTLTSQMIEPWENGKVIPTFRTEPWMFEKVTPDDAAGKA
jgi:hypothetical protein